jgi:hypothetical protein
MVVLDRWYLVRTDWGACIEDTEKRLETSAVLLGEEEMA